MTIKVQNCNNCPFRNDMWCGYPGSTVFLGADIAGFHEDCPLTKITVVKEIM